MRIGRGQRRGNSLLGIVFQYCIRTVAPHLYIFHYLLREGRERQIVISCQSALYFAIRMRKSQYIYNKTSLIFWVTENIHIHLVETQGGHS